MTKWLALILVLGLILRLSLLFWLSGEKLSIVDEQHYDQLATELAVSGNYQVDGKFVSLRPPLFPWCVSQVYRVCGVGNYMAVRVLQIFLALLTVVCVYGLAKEFLAEVISAESGKRWALVAAAVFCFYPSMIGDTFLVLTETLFTFWIVLILWTSVHFFRTGSLFVASFCGVFIGLGALTRSILWMSPIPLALFILCFAAGISLRRRVAAVALMCVLAAAVMAPWMVRNTRVQKTLTAIDCMSGRNLMMGNYEYTPLYRAWDAVMVPSPKDWSTVLYYDYRERTGENIFRKTQGQIDKEAGSYAKRYILAHPGQTVKRDAVKALCFWQLERSLPAGIQKGCWGFAEVSPKARQGWVAGVGCLIQAIYCPLFITAVLGVCLGFSRISTRQKTVQAFLCCIVLYFWGIHALIFAHERYHLPVVPILILFAVLFGVRRSDLRQYLHRHPVLSACAGLFLAIVAVFWCVEVSLLF